MGSAVQYRSLTRPRSFPSRSDTDSAIQTDESNFSSLRNSLDQAPLSTVAAPIVAIADVEPSPETPVTPTTTTTSATASTRQAFAFDSDAEDSKTLRRGSSDAAVRPASGSDDDADATASTAAEPIETGGAMAGRNEESELNSFGAKTENVDDAQRTSINESRTLNPSTKKTGITGRHLVWLRLPGRKFRPLIPD